MMNERMQTKYMTVLEDMYLSDEFKLHEMRAKHRVSSRMISICVKIGYVQKVQGTWYKWTKGLPSKRHLSRIKKELDTPKKRVIKLLWGLITYEV